jgi:hypothetical protein
MSDSKSLVPVLRFMVGLTVLAAVALVVFVIMFIRNDQAKQQSATPVPPPKTEALNEQGDTETDAGGQSRWPSFSLSNLLGKLGVGNSDSAQKQPGDGADPQRPDLPLVTTEPGRMAIERDSVGEFFGKLPPSAPPKGIDLQALRGKWQVKVTTIDLGPGVLAPDVSEIEPFTFAIEGNILSPQTGRGAVRNLMTVGDKIIARAPERPDMLLRLVNGNLTGSIESSDSGRMEFNATRLP